MASLQNFGGHFLANLRMDLDEIQHVATTGWFVEAHAKFILDMYYWRDKLLLDFMKYRFDIVMLKDTCESVCFKLDVMLNTKLNSLIPVSMTLMYTQGHRILRKLELVLSFCCKIAWSNWNVHDGWLWKGGDSKCGKYGSLEHLFFLLVRCLTVEYMYLFLSHNRL